MKVGGILIPWALLLLRAFRIFMILEHGIGVGIMNNSLAFRKLGNFEASGGQIFSAGPPGPTFCGILQDLPLGGLTIDHPKKKLLFSLQKNQRSFTGSKVSTAATRRSARSLSSVAPQSYW